jgi:hypothetical protein
MRDADRQYLDRIVEDCAQLLGAGVELGALELETNGETVLRLHYRLGCAFEQTEGSRQVGDRGPCRAQASAGGDRIGLGVRALAHRPR